MKNEPLLPPICGYNKNSVTPSANKELTWDFYPEKKIEFLVKGFSHRIEAYRRIETRATSSKFPLGMRKIHLETEPGNKADKMAIAVYLGELHIGYIPKWLTSTFHKEWNRIGDGYIYELIKIQNWTACRVVMGYDDYQIDDFESVNISSRFDDLLDDKVVKIEAELTNGLTVEECRHIYGGHGSWNGHVHNDDINHGVLFTTSRNLNFCENCHTVYCNNNPTCHALGQYCGISIAGYTCGKLDSDNPNHNP